jgi:hypothetical protein
MSETAAAPTPVVQEPTKIPPPVAAGPQGAAAMVDDPMKKNEPVADDPMEFELDIKGQKQKLKFQTKEQLKAVLQKALYADQIIKDGAQAKKGAETLMQKIKTEQGLREVLQDPDINMDVKKFAINSVKEMMEDEKLSPEQREARDAIKERDQLRAEKKAAEELAARQREQAKQMAQATEMRKEIISAMEKYPDIPKTQATMDAVIQNMRAAFRRFGRHLTPDQAMSVYSQQYWTALTNVIEKMEPDAIVKRFGQKALDRIQNFKLNQLKEKTNPANQVKSGNSEIKKKKHLTEKDFEKHFSELAGL